MSFQFQCPHCQQILEGDPAQASQMCQCPTCGQQFIIPAPLDPADAGLHAAASSASLPASSPESPAGGESFPEVIPGVKSNPFAPPGPKMYHIPCPQCPDQRLLETPAEMLGQDAICPYCGVRLRLRENDSLEYKRQRQEEIERKERKAGRAWLNAAIVFVVLTVIALLGLFMMATPD
jgi:transcription elongation factor Elf1